MLDTSPISKPKKSSKTENRKGKNCEQGACSEDYNHVVDENNRDDNDYKINRKNADSEEEPFDEVSYFEKMLMCLFN